MLTYIGPLGGLVPLWGVNSLSINTERKSRELVTATGRRKVQRSSISRREWSVSTNELAKPEELAGLQDLELGSTPPWTWVDPYAQVTNMLSPEQSVLMPGTWSGSAFLEGGSAVGSDGVYSARSVSSGFPNTVIFGYRDGVRDDAAAIAGMPVCGSAYARGAGRIRIYFYNFAGNQISNFSQGFNNTLLSRVSIIRTAPVETASVRIALESVTRAAMPAITWSGSLLPWAVGHGCNRVIASGLSESITQAMSELNGRRRASLSFTVREVG